uniref:FBD domain-containing protein n=1 Tax=Panagrellus redivivus TaxID=6233 RepID=A0A7E4ZWF5_PANRE
MAFASVYPNWRPPLNVIPCKSPLLTGDTLIRSTLVEFTLDQANVQTLEHDVFSHVIFAPKHLILNDCSFSSDFVKKIALLIGAHVEELVICGHRSSTVDLTQVLSAFPCLESVYMREVCPPSTWMNDMMPVGRCRFTRLEWLFEGLQFLQFTFEELVDFLEAQQNGFNLRITVYSMTPETTKHLDELEKFLCNSKHLLYEPGNTLGCDDRTSVTVDAQRKPRRSPKTWSLLKLISRDNAF